MDFREDEFDVFEKGDFMETIRNVEINQLHDFKNHPFKVEVNTELCELMKSIEKEGVLVPLLVRTNPYGDGYEIISGHRRKEAAVWAGETKVPVVIRELDDDQAVVAMVDSNLHRENLKPSEKAFAYKMKLDAMKHQGKRLSDDSLSDNEAEVLAGNEANHMTLAQAGPKCDTDGDGRVDNSGNRANEVVEEHSMMNSNELLTRQVGESVAQIKRYIRLTNLIPKILAMVDEGKIAFTIGVELSYLSEEEQYELHAVMDLEQCTPSLSQANRMKRMSQRGELGMDAIYLVLEEEKPNQSEQIKIRADTLDDYFPDGFTPKQKVELIKKLVKEWHEVIENFLREGETDISEPYAILMKEASGEYASQIFQKLHDYEYNEQMMKLYIMGGGARLIEIFGDYDRDRVTFNHDIRANAKGYEYYCYMILKQQQGRKAM